MFQQRMDYVPRTAATFEWQGSDIRLVGGFSTFGFRPPGLERRRFLCLGVPELSTGPREDALLGHVEVFVRPMPEPLVEGLVVISVPDDRRRRGYGRRIVDAVRHIAPGPLTIHGITEQAVPFWEAMGAQIDAPTWSAGRREALLEEDRTIRLEASLNLF